jgi:hypothetical protein
MTAALCRKVNPAPCSGPSVRRRQPPVARDHVEDLVDGKRRIEPERRDAAGDVTDLLGAMPGGVARIGLEAGKGDLLGLKPRRGLRRRFRGNK